MISSHIAGNFNRIKNRQARRDRRAHEKQARRNNSATFNLNSRDRDICFSYTVSADSRLSFLFKLMSQEIRERLKRKQINSMRRGLAHTLLNQAEEITYLRYKGQGGAFLLRSEKEEDIYLSIRSEDCRVFDCWHWVIQLSQEEQSTVLMVMSIYEGISLRMIRRLITEGEVSYDSRFHEKIFIKYADGELSAEIFNLTPLETEMVERIPTMAESAFSFYEELGSAA